MFVLAFLESLLAMVMESFVEVCVEIPDVHSFWLLGLLEWVYELANPHLMRLDLLDDLLFDP